MGKYRDELAKSGVIEAADAAIDGVGTWDKNGRKNPAQAFGYAVAIGEGVRTGLDYWREFLDTTLAKYQVSEGGRYSSLTDGEKALLAETRDSLGANLAACKVSRGMVGKGGNLAAAARTAAPAQLRKLLQSVKAAAQFVIDTADKLEAMEANVHLPLSPALPVPNPGRDVVDTVKKFLDQQNKRLADALRKYRKWLVGVGIGVGVLILGALLLWDEFKHRRR